jgi:hypothetical protein
MARNKRTLPTGNHNRGKLGSARQDKPSSKAAQMPHGYVFDTEATAELSRLFRRVASEFLPRRTTPIASPIAQPCANNEWRSQSISCRFVIACLTFFFDKQVGHLGLQVAFGALRPKPQQEK